MTENSNLGSFIAGARQLLDASDAGRAVPESSHPHRFWGTELGRRMAQDYFNYFLSKVVPGLMGLLSVLVFVRLVGYEQYGRYAVVSAFGMAWASGMAASPRPPHPSLQTHQRNPA